MTPPDTLAFHAAAPGGDRADPRLAGIEPVMRGEGRWRAAMEEHRVSLDGFLTEAKGVDEVAWARSPAPGKWAPAEIAEHLSLVYGALLAELRGETPLAFRVPPWRRTLLRWFLLPHVLFHRRIPAGAPAPRETRPAGPLAEREVLLHRLRGRAERFERELDAARCGGGGQLTHPYFGTLAPLQTLRFCALHLEHHREQLGARSR